MWSLNRELPSPSLSQSSVRMRIAFVTREYPPETAWGGIGSFYASLARSLVEAGHDVEVFAQGLDREYSKTDESGVLVHRVLGRKDGFGEPTGGSLAGGQDLGLFALGLASAMHDAVVNRHGAAPFDIIEGHEHLGINAFVNASDFIDAVTVTRYHSAYHTLVRRNLVDWPASRLVEELERAAIQSAHYRVSTSEVISRAVAEDFGSPKADTILPNFVKTAPYLPSWNKKKDRVLFVGRLVLGHKRPDIAIKAFLAFAAGNPGWDMVIAGPDQDHPEHGTVWKYLERLIPADMAKRVRYVGPQPQAKIYDLMAESKALLAPSDFESFGMVAVEALQHECLPFVSSDTAMADIVHDPSLVCQKGSVDDFAAHLRDVLLSDRSARKLAEDGRAHALESFSERKVILDNIKFFAEAAEKARPAMRVRHIADARPSAASQQPLVSIVVPNFNGGRFIAETLDSLVTQDYPNLEIIVVDGGSTDDTAKIVARYPDVIFVSEPDKGQAHAINKGLLRARGQILAYLNSDDIYQPGAIRTVVEHFRRRPDASVLVGECNYIDEDSKVIGHLVPKYSGQQGIIRYWGWDKWHTIPQQSTFWRREVVERVGLFATERHFVMDLDYWVRVAGVYDFHLAPETLAGFRLVTGTKTVSSTDRMYAEELQTFYRYRSLLPRGRRLGATWACNRHFSERLLGFAEHLTLEEGHRRRSARLALTAVKRFPLRMFDIRFMLLAGHLGATVVGLRWPAEKVHRRVLKMLWRMKHGT